MPHYKLMYPSEYLNAADLQGKDATVTIESVQMELVPGADGNKKNKPVICFQGKKKRLPLPKTCAKSIARQHGTDTAQWIGKQITIYPTTCQAFGEEVECIRVK